MRSHKGILDVVSMNRKLYNEQSENQDSEFKLPPATKALSSNKLIKGSKRKTPGVDSIGGSK